MVVSIVIPIYNTKFGDLVCCIDSILGQTYEDFEIVIVDDGSKQDYQKKLDTLQNKDSRIKIFHKVNEGVSVARNYGVEHSSGDYVLFVDGDDILTPYALQSGIDCIENTGCDVAIGKIYSTSVRPKKYPERANECNYEILDNKDKKEILKAHIFAKNCVRWQCDEKGWEFNGEGCWAHLMKRQVAQSIQFIPNIAVGEDTIWALEMLKEKYNYTITLVDELWYYYIQNEYSVLNKYNPNIIDQLSAPVKILDKNYGNTTGFIYESYIDWILIKLKQICYRAFLTDECEIPKNKRSHRLSLVLKDEPWSTILKRRTPLSLKKKIKFFLYRNNFMYYIYIVVRKIRSLKH